MEKDFIPDDRALRMKALGFDEPCFGTWIRKVTGEYSFSLAGSRNSKDWDGSRHCAAPTFSQAFRFSREKYGLYPHIFSKENGTFTWCIRWYVEGSQKDTPYESSSTYEQAELACLDKLIEIVESKSE